MSSYFNDFNRVLQDIAHRHRPHTVYADFLELSAYAIANRIYRSDELEQCYMDCVKKYSKEEAMGMSKLLALTFNALRSNARQDFLGSIFEYNNFGNALRGQFFTPYPVASLCAQVTFGGTIPEVGYLTLGEPAAGGGCMVIAFADAMRENGFDPTEQLVVIADDIDALCFHMCYVQLSILGIPALVRHHDTIRVETYRSLMTPSLASQFDKFSSFFNEDSTNTRRVLDEDSPTKYKEKENSKISSTTVHLENDDAARHHDSTFVLQHRESKGKARTGQIGFGFE